MVRVFGSVVAIAGLGLLGASACSGDGDDARKTNTDAGTGSGGSSAGSGQGGTSPTGGSAQSGSGGEAGATPPPPCPQCESGYCLDDGACVECLPNPDTCESGYCGPDNTCVAGCSGGNTCASGECVAGSCERCVDDLECEGDKICGSGVCAAPCTGSGDCSMTCCSARCVDTTRDIGNCGGCGIACDEDEFCSNTGCRPATLANLCATDSIAVVLNGMPTDNAAVTQMRGAIADACGSATKIRSVSQSTTDLLNPATGQPVAGGGEVLVLAGGAFGHTHVGYLETRRISPIYSTQADGNMLEFRESGSDNVVMSTPYASITESHDFFVIQMARDPKTGTTSVLAYGFFDGGTKAAGWYFANELAPALSEFTGSWYVYEWTDEDGDKAPSADEISLADSG